MEYFTRNRRFLFLIGGILLFLLFLSSSGGNHARAIKKKMGPADSASSDTEVDGPTKNANFPRLFPLPRLESAKTLKVGDDVLIFPESLTYKGEDLIGQRAKIFMWDDKNEVWAVRLGKNGEVIGAKTSKLWKIRHVSLEELPESTWAQILDEDTKLIALPQGAEIRIDINKGLKWAKRPSGGPEIMGNQEM